VTRLIINGDDFGATPGINGAIIRAFREGVLTSCSLMVGENAWGDAARMAREARGLAVGLHLVAVMGKSVLPPARIPHLVDREGRFSTRPAVSGTLHFFSRQARRELADEMRAQFERFLSTGLEMSHVDAHLHFHLHPVILACAVRLCREHGVRGMRVPEDDPALFRDFCGGMSLRQRALWRVFRVRVRRMKAQLDDMAIVYPRRVFGVLGTGRMDKAYVNYLLDHLPPGDVEIYFHPDESPGASTASAQRRRELMILLDPGLKARIAQRGLPLIHYGHLKRSS
jgi:hopanoid biosynthesis associated protein HpnK